MSYSIFLLSLAAFASAASMRVTDALLPRLATDFGVGIAHASYVVTGFAVAYGLMQVVFGPLGDRFGKLRVIACSSAIAAAASLACLLAPGFEGLLAARVVAGAFCGSIIPLAMAWIGDVVPYKDRQPVLARFILGQIFGIAAGTAVGGLAAGHPSWRWPFAALAAWLAICALLIGLASRHDPVPRALKSSHFARDAAGILRGSWPRVVVSTVFVEGMLVFGALAFIPTHLHFQRGIDLATAGLALVPYALGGVGFAVAARPILRRFGEVRLSRVGTLLLAAGFLAIAFAPHLALAALGCLVAGFGFYGLHNTLQTNATQMAPERRGAGMALFASLFFIGQSLGVAMAGALVERAGTTAVLAGAAVLLVPVGLTFAALRAAHERDP
ncbi:MAG TPA: MFS transporter [Usitatibacter sp.]|nr:MFS transporter [Usitatibacter sp.]